MRLKDMLKCNKTHKVAIHMDRFILFDVIMVTSCSHSQCEQFLFWLHTLPYHSPGLDNSWLMGNVPHKSDAALSVFILLL